MEEAWKQIEGYEKYEVSTHGRIRKGNKFLKPIRSVRKGGYTCLTIGLCKDGIQKFFIIARLMGFAFIPCIEGKNTIDHINQNSTDNRLENLRWEDGHGQAMNQKHILGISGHRNISKKGNGWQVSISRHSKYVFNKSFKTLEEAISARDAWFRDS